MSSNSNLTNNDTIYVPSEDFRECVRLYRSLSKEEKIRFNRDVILRNSVADINPASRTNFNESN